MNIDLAPHIYTLLFQQETVIFPNFGGLVSSYNPSSIDYVQGIIYPPSKTLSFNERLMSNDGVLEHFVRTKFELTGEEACAAIEKFISDMEATLDKGEIVLFPKVGRLYKNYERKLQFLQENTNFNKDTFGLPPVHFYPILRSSYGGTQISDAAKPVEHPKMVGKPKSFTKWMQVAMPILVGCAMISIAVSLYFIAPVKEGSQVGQIQTLPVGAPRLNQKPEMELAGIGNSTLSDRSEDSYENIVLEEPIAEEEIVETESPRLAPSTNECIIIVGAFKNKSGVQTTIEKIYDIGYDAYQDKKNNLTRVGVQLAYDDDADVERALHLLRKKVNKKAWVFKK